MENNKKQDPKFKELSTKKKVIHYVGWPLLVLGCVGTIVFGSLWCKNRNNHQTFYITYSADEWDEDYEAIDIGAGFHHIIPSIKADDKYILTANLSDLPNDYDPTKVNGAIFGSIPILTDEEMEEIEDEFDYEKKLTYINWGMKMYIDSEELPDEALYTTMSGVGLEGGQIYIDEDLYSAATGKTLTFSQDSKITFEFSFVSDHEGDVCLFTVFGFNE